MVADGRYLRNWTPRRLVLVGAVSFFLFSVSYFVEVRIILVDPDYGDVTHVVETLWRGLLGFTTVGSFLLGIRGLVREGRQSNGPAARVEIGGAGHEIHVYADGKSPDEPMVSVSPSEHPTDSTEEPPDPDGDDENSEPGR